MSQLQIVGGVFGLEEPLNSNHTSPDFIKINSILLANARSGIWLLMTILAPSQVWLPSFLCSAILESIDHSTTRVRFYEVDHHLAITSSEWLDQVRNHDLVVLIDYFGFPCDSSCIHTLKERGAWILEDACQALLSAGIGQSTDFVLFSPRKFLGVPDGGILNCTSTTLIDLISLVDPPAQWWLKSLSATLLRHQFDAGCNDRRWFPLFQQAEQESPCGPYCMSQFSRMLLAHSFDYSAIAQKRIENYQYLAQRLREFALFPQLLPGAVPIGFPVRVSNRDSVRQALFAHEIYPPIHWQIQGWADHNFVASHRLAAEIMTIPCDQRYDIAAMEQIALVFRQAAE